MKTKIARLRHLRHHLGVREDVIAAIVLVALGVAGLSFTLITHVGTPAGAALAYMVAIDRADTNYVWAHTTVDSNSTAPATMSMLDRAALAAQLKSTAHTRSNLKVQDVGYVSSGTKVTLTYDSSVGRRSLRLIMRGASPHSWPVLVQPAGLDLTLPPGAGALSLDGTTVDVPPSGELKAAVFPGRHQVAFGPSSLYLSYVGDVDVKASLPSLTRVDLSAMKLTDQALASAKQAVSDAFKNCAAASVLKPERCPQSLTTDLASDAPRWSLLGDPLVDASVGLNDRSQIQVSGHYLMRLTYRSEIVHRTRVIGVGGPYAATLTWNGSAMSMSGFGSAPPAMPIPRPAASDAQVLSALKAQFDSCLAIQAGVADGCPQWVLALYASNFVWRANGDPMQGATVAWDSAPGLFKVTGTFDFSVDYNSTPPYSPTRHYQDHSSGQYVADLYWDGSKAVFVGFEK